jgi:ABC-type Zn2+ transport system substrate-binding protein/surface adhesin
MVGFSMQNPTPFFPCFYLQTLCRKPRSASQMLADKLDQLKQNSFSQLGDCFSYFIPKYLLQPAGSGALSRQRFFSKENTF